MADRELMTIEDVRKLLREHCDAAGDQAAFARFHDFSPQYISQVLIGRLRPSFRLCEAIGIVEVERWAAK